VSSSTIDKSEIANPDLAAQGKKRIEWAERSMPVLAQIRDRFTLEQPFKGVRMCLKPAFYPR
jgi:adenosylhomocysteinase